MTRVRRAYLGFTGACDLHGDPPTYMNYGDCAISGLLPLHAMMCSSAGYCDISSRQGLTLIDLNNHNSLAPYPSWFLEYTSCLASDIIPINATRPDIVLLEHAVAGARQMCTTPGCEKVDDLLYMPISPAYVQTWRHLLEQCFNFNSATHRAVPDSPPRILVADRRYESGRHMFNVNSLVDFLKQRYDAQITLAYPGTMSVQQQAHLFAAHSILIHVHGSILGNYPFLPMNAVAIQISPFGDLFGDARFPSGLVRLFNGTTNIRWLPLVLEVRNFKCHVTRCVWRALHINAYTMRFAGSNLATPQV